MYYYGNGYPHPGTPTGYYTAGPMIQQGNNASLWAIVLVIFILFVIIGFGFRNNGCGCGF